MNNKIYDEILSFFPSSLSEINFLNEDIINNAEEIRIRIGQPLNVRNYENDIFLKKIVNESDILKLLENFSENSIYTVQNEINSGYITLKGRT